MFRARPARTFDLYAVEGGTAAMCYIFKSLKAARLLNAGDTIALAVPIFTPCPGDAAPRGTCALNVINISAEREDTYQFTAADFKQLEDPKVKAFFSDERTPATRRRWRSTRIRLTCWSISSKTKQPDLIILTDDVCDTFVHGFRSLMERCQETRLAFTRARNTLAAPAGDLVSSHCIGTISSTR